MLTDFDFPLILLVFTTTSPKIISKLQILFMFGLKNILISLISISILGAVGIASYLVYSNISNSDYTPSAVSKQFIEILQNPTDTITPNEKATLAQISQSNFINTYFDEMAIKKFRKATQNSQTTLSEVKKISNQYYLSTISLTNKDKKRTIKLFIEQTGSFWSGGQKSKIYKIESDIEDEKPIVTDIKDKISEKIKSLAEDAGKFIESKDTKK